ncbi:hypothetical protein [Micromonospora carbonacea]|uniref:hypothetical protein n=1 Tax=Micromonospora carbonacea TaxID=47853 RepID=UPI003D709083
MTRLLDWIARRLAIWITVNTLLMFASMWAISASYRAPAGEEQPKVTDWMQAWGAVFGVVAGLAAAVAAAALLMHERAAAKEARRQLAEEREVNLQKERKASIEVRSEQYRKVNRDRVSQEQRYVVKNHGPAEAHSVEVTFFHEGKPVDLHLSGWNHRPTTPLLHPGEELHMNYAPAWGDTMPEKVVVAWQDGRNDRQSQEFYPSHRDL